MASEMMRPAPLLLVEDEMLILDVLESALVEGGYEVVQAQNGAEALQILEADGVLFVALVTDIRLGSGPDGWDVATRAREIAPHMPIVFMSGDSAHEWASRGVPGSVILPKPFAPAQLVTAVSMLVTEANQHLPPEPHDGDNS